MITHVLSGSRLGGLHKWARTLALGLAAGLGAAPLAAQAQLVLTSAAPKTETFDGLGTTAAATVPAGFKLSGEAAPTYTSTANYTTTSVAANGNNFTTGGTYNFGAGAGSTDRAVGFLNSGSFGTPRHILVQVSNTTGSTIQDLSVQFSLEKYRSGSREYNWTFWTSPDGVTWTAQPTGAQNYPADASNSVYSYPPLTVSKTVPLSGVNLANGATYYLRWTQVGVGGTVSGATNGQGAGLDDVTLTPTLAGGTTPAPVATITTGSVSPTSFCVTNAAGSASFSVPFSTTGTLGGTYSVQLSDASGAFANTTSNLIGSGSSSPIAAAIPASTASGTGYRVRVLNDNPATTGSDNGQNLTVSLTAASNPVTVTPGGAQSVTTTGTGATLVASATLSGSTYAWQYGTSAGGPFAALGSATGASYTISGAAFPGAGIYYVVAQATAATSCGSVVGTSDPVTVTVTAPAATPVITVSDASLTDFGSVAVGAGSLLKDFTVEGTGLTGSLTITPPAGFEIRLEGGAFACCPITLTPSGGTVPSTTIEVRFVPTAAQAYAASITVAGSGQPTQSVAVSGTGVEAVYPATLSTAALTDITGTTATAGGTIAADGGSAVTARGVVWSKTANPTVVLATKTADGAGTGTFASSLTGLVPGTTYYVRAYATNGVGTTYGEELSFSTVAVPLADEPASQATVAQGTLGSTSVQLLLGGGPSQKRLVLARLGSAVEATPTDATTYTADAAFGSGQAIAAGTYVVYNGTGSEVTVTGLRPNTPYSFAVFAFNDNNTPYAENYLTTTPGTLSVSTPVAPAALLLEENFEYPVGALLTANNWTAHSGAGTKPITVVDANLAQAGYGPNSGNAAALTASGEDVNRQFAPVYARTPAYAAFLVKVNSVTTAGDYFFHLGPQTIGSTFRARVFVRRTASGKVQFGTSSGTSAATYTSAEYDLGSTNLLVVKYVFDEAGNSSQLFINPAADTEPATADATSTETGTTPGAPNDNIGSVALRQGSSSPNLVVDGLRVGNTFRVVKTGLTCSPPAPAFTAAPVCVGSPTAFVNSSTAVESNATYAWDVNSDGTVDFTTAGNISYTYPAAGTYTATLTITQGTCTDTYTQQVTVRALPTATLSGSATVCAGTAASLTVHLTGTAPYTLGYSADGGKTATTLTINAADLNADGNYLLAVQPSATTTYSLTAVADANCTGATVSGTATVTVNSAPVLTVPAGLTATAAYGQAGASVSFAATATGTAPAISYSIGQNGTTKAITSPYYFPVGTTTVTATATNNCGTDTKTFTVTVQATAAAVSVLYQNADYLATDNVIRPYLQLVNKSGAAIPYKELTVRYYLTAEEFAPVQAAIDYAQLGTSGVKARYVALAQPAQGAFGYVEYSFTSAAALGAGANSGVIQSRIYKQTYTTFDETDDYSYGINRTFAATDRITVYRNGTLVGGVEPAAVPAVTKLVAVSQNVLLTPFANTISLFEQVRNVGNVPVPYQDLTVRYWFTPDGTAALKAAVDYAQLGNSNVSVTFGQAGTETYAELHFAAGLGSLAPLSHTGQLNYRIYKNDWSFFNQANDWSYRATTFLPVENQRVTVYQQGQLVYGQEPAGAKGSVATARTALAATPSDASSLLAQEPVFEAFPNPFSERTALHFRPAGDGAARLVLYNALGQVVKTLFDGAAQAGQDYGFTLEAAGLSSGVYTAQLQVDGKTQLLRLVVAQ